MEGSSIPLRRQQELQFITGLNEKFQNYAESCRNMREQASRVESINLANMTKALEDELMHSKNLYENELQNIRSQYEDLAREKNQYQFDASQKATKIKELEEKLADENTNRKKVENWYADAQRVIADKDKQLEEAKVAITQEQNSHLETQKEKECLQKQLTETQDLYNAEAATRGHFENLSNQLKDKLDFDRQRFEQEICDYLNRIKDLEAALKAAEERIHEHNLIDEDLANQLAKVKSQCDADLQRYKQESQLNFDNSLAHCKAELQSETEKLAKSNDENIKLKARIDELHTRVTNAEARAVDTESQNQKLISDLADERQQAKKTIEEMEDKSRELQESLNAKIRMLNEASNASLPINVELDAMAALLDAEGRRLNVYTADSPQVVTRSQFLSRAGTSPSKTSPPGSVVGVKPLQKRSSTPKLSRSNSVTKEPLPPVVDAPGRIASAKTNDGLHQSLPEPLPKGVNPYLYRQPQVPITYMDRKYSRYYAYTQPTRVQPMHKRNPTN